MSHICPAPGAAQDTGCGFSLEKPFFLPAAPARRIPAVAQPSASLADDMVDVDMRPFTTDGLPRTLWWDKGAGVLRMIDQTRLPGEVVVLTCATSADVAAAIRRLQVRGAPAIGVAAAYGLALGAREVVAGDASQARLEEIAAQLRATRPTAVNLGWALDRQLSVASDIPPTELPERLLAEAHAIADEDAAACRAMGRLGAELIAAGDTLLTHCNAGALATAGMGTALAPIFTAHQAGKRLHVYVDETRPVLQGARLTAWELGLAGVPYTLIADNMAAHFLRREGIRGVFVGADRIAANGDVANKIGTYGLAILAREHGVPLYVVAPRSTVDLALPDGDAIPIEERAQDEITTLAGRRIAPADARVANPAFDVTPARYVAAIVTEAGVARPPYGAALAELMRD
jgi:methylthioribose-1-phosphate isomerase